MGELAILRGDKNDEVYNRDNENIAVIKNQTWKSSRVRIG